MKKYILILSLILFLIINTAWAQHAKGREQIESARIAYITEKIALTPDQSQDFWPTYNEFREQHRDLKRKEMRLARLDIESVSENEAKNKLDESLKIKEEMLALDRKYQKKLLEIISAKQTLHLLKAEIEFKRIVLKKLGQRGKR